MCKPLYIPVNENENHWVLVIAFPKTKLFFWNDLSKTDFKRKASEINVLTSYCERRNQSMHFQSWKFRILNGRKKLNTTDCGAFVLSMAMEIATKK